MQTTYDSLLHELRQTWPSDIALDEGSTSFRVRKGHPIAAEIDALKEGERASFPYFTNNKVAWITVAPDVSELAFAVNELRAWIIPSLGWEDETKPIALPGESDTALGELLFAISPSGYFRWWTRKADVSRVFAKLKLMRSITLRRPPKEEVLNLSLFELRQQFEVALALRDHDSAQAIIDVIDKHELDSAVNTAFMRIRIWDQFRDFSSIVDFARLPDIVQVKLPRKVRAAIVRAFYFVFLSEIDESNRPDEGLSVFASKIDPAIGAIISAGSPEDGTEMARIIAYRAARRNDLEAAADLGTIQDDIVLRLISRIGRGETPQSSKQSVAEKYVAAVEKGDWAAIQRFGPQLVESAEELPEDELFDREALLQTLKVSLRFHANSDLKSWLDDYLLVHYTKGPPSMEDEGALVSAQVAPPQTWQEYLEFIQEGRLLYAEQFLSLENRPLFSSLGLAQTYELAEVVEELLTDPAINASQPGYQLTIAGLTTFISELLISEDFPCSELLPVYQKFLEIWSEQKKYSTTTLDGNILHTLAWVCLHLGGREDLVVNALSGWWHARQVKARLPFLLQYTDLISEYTSSQSVAETLWIGGASFINKDPLSVTATERLAWQRLGERLGLDKETVSEYFAIADGEDEIALDPLSEIDLNKVAIVSLREKAAEAAAEIIRERTNAQVVVVTDTSAGGETDSAKTADIILFVWSSATHAVYRAFDGVRDKIAYVQGTGASSIVIALERWAQTQQA